MWAGFVWVGYIALEPFVRRLWPRAIISWNRALQGRLRDPMVGRDILMGATIGLSFIAPFAVFALVFPGDQLRPSNAFLVGLVGVRQSVSTYFELFGNSLVFPVLILLLLVLLRFILRKQWAAVIVSFLLLSAPNTLFLGPLNAWPFWLHYALLLFALTRFGVLACLTAVFFSNPNVVVLTLDPDSWYAGRSLLSLLLLATIAGYGFWTSLAGRRLLAEKFFQTGQTRGSC